MATTGQINLIRTIMSERELEGHHVEWVEARLDRANNALVQEIITRLKALPRKGEQGALMTLERPTTNPVTEEGFYQLGDDVFRVVRTRDGQRLYAKQATAAGWDYESGKGMMRRLTAEMKMTPEQIAAFGATHGFCLNCSAPLSDPISVHIGLGTTCGPSILGSEAYKVARKAAKLVPAVAEALAAIKAEKDAEKARGVQEELPVAEEVKPDFMVTLPDGTQEYDAEAALAYEETKPENNRPVSQFEAIYFAMADMGFTDEQIRDARYGQGNW